LTPLISFDFAERHGRRLVAENASDRAVPAPGGKLRVGYVSADFRLHSIFYFIEPLFVHHDRGRFEIVCYSNTQKPDAATRQLRNHVPHWRDISSLSDEAAVELIKQDDIDLLVDLSGHTSGNRLLMFSRKPAPVQMTYLGYSNTTGVATIDYRITDQFVDPEGISDAMYSEALLRMPHSLWCYRPPMPMPDVNTLPALTHGKTTFASVSNFTKVNRRIIELWAQILANTPNSELLIAGAPAGETQTRVLGQFESHGVDATRIQFVGKVNYDDYLALYQRMDIVLDTFPYAGGTTTCESLWMGVPVVTLAGKSGVSRAGVSLLSTVGLADLIANTPEQYVSIAADLAHDTPRLATLRAGLRDQMRNSPLMDERNFARAYESLLVGAYARSSAKTDR
jgi:protein O-GlcNAc transferase